MITLVRPSLSLVDSWREAAAEFDDPQPHGFALIDVTVDDLADDDVVRRWLERATLLRTRAVGRLVPSSIMWIVDDADPERVLGSIDLRRELNENLFAHGGHIGYGVRESARGAGVATAALRLTLDDAAAHGIDRVLLTCDRTNIASARTIVAAGGVFEGHENGSDRYWIVTDRDPR